MRPRGLISRKQREDPAISFAGQRLQVEYRPVGWLKPYENNPRKNDKAVDRMVASILEFGFAIPCLVQSTGEVVDGHLRLKAAIKLKLTEVPLIICDTWTDAQVKAFRLMVNRSVNWADWDLGALRLEFAELKAMEFNLALTGFDDLEIADFGAETSPGQVGLTPDDQAPQLGEAAVTQAGNLWQLGDHRLMCGDATIVPDMLRLLGGNKADLVVIDPPFNVNYVGKTKEALKIKNDKMADGPFFSFLLAAYQNLAMVTNEGAGIYVFHADTEGMNFRRALVEAGWKLAQCCVWVKQTLVMGRQDYHWQHEPVLYGWKPGASHRWFTDRKQTTVWNFDRPTRSTEHPTMKPVDLISYPIINSSKKGDLVLDSFGGAGSTMIACAKYGRVARLLELDPRYCDVIIERWQAWSGQQAKLEGDGRTFDEIKNERRLIPLGTQDAITKEVPEVYL